MVTLTKLEHTWVKEDDGFQAGIFIVIYLQLLEGEDQLVQDADGHAVHLHQFRAVPWDDVVVSFGQTAQRPSPCHCPRLIKDGKEFKTQVTNADIILRVEDLSSSSSAPSLAQPTRNADLYCQSSLSLLRSHSSEETLNEEQEPFSESHHSLLTQTWGGNVNVHSPPTSP